MSEEEDSFYCRWCIPKRPYPKISGGVVMVKFGNKEIPICYPCHLWETRKSWYRRFRYEVGCKYAGQYKNLEEFEVIFNREYELLNSFGEDVYEEEYMKWDIKYLDNLDYYYEHIKY